VLLVKADRTRHQAVGDYLQLMLGTCIRPLLGAGRKAPAKVLGQRARELFQFARINQSEQSHYSTSSPTNQGVLGGNSIRRVLPRQRSRCLFQCCNRRARGDFLRDGKEGEVTAASEVIGGLHVEVDR